MKRGRDESDSDSAAAAATAAAASKRQPDGKAAPAGASDMLASLPLATLSHVWSYAVALGASDNVCANAEHQMLQRNVYDLQLVCRAWRDSAQEILRERLRGVAVVDVVAAVKAQRDTSTTLVLNVEPFDKTSPVTDLRVVMGDIYSGHDFNDRGIWMDDEQALIAVRVQRAQELEKRQPEIDWEATLKPCGESITRLDLSHMLLFTHHLGGLLRAAAKLCPNVKAVIMPPREKKHYKNESIRIENMDALSEAMRAWLKSNGGLTHLRVPYIGAELIGTVVYMNNITTCCKDLQHLDGWRFTFIEQCNLTFVTCDEFWMTPPELWEDFWQKSRLKTFNTVVLPFSEDFLGPLGDHHKPALEELTLSFNSLLINTNDDLDSELFQSIVQCTPNLRKLSVVIGDTEEDEWAASIAFDDAFLTAVSKECAKLQNLTIKSSKPVDSISVVGLAALVGMPELKNISLRCVETLDDSFFELLQSRMRKKKDLRLRLTIKRINDLIWKVMARVADMKTEEFNGVSMSLSLKTPDLFGYDREDEQDQNGRCHKAEDIEALYEEIKRVHGNTVRLHLHMTLPQDEDDETELVQFDSLELSINDPQGFACQRDKFIEIGNEDIEQELCGEEIRVDGIYVRDPEGSLEQLEYIKEHDRPRKLHVPGLMSDDDEGDSEGGDEGEPFHDELDAGMVFDVDDDDELGEEDSEESGGEEDIFGNGEEDDEDDEIGDEE